MFSFSVSFDRCLSGSIPEELGLNILHYLCDWAISSSDRKKERMSFKSLFQFL